MKRYFALALLLTASLACNTLSLSSPTPYPCPQGTAELFYVEPIPATTNETTVTVHVYLGNLDEITILTESGTFTSTTGDVEVTLLPDTIHHLEVRGKVRQMGQPGGCQYGGYTLTATNDRDGNPLVIEQTNATPTPTPCPQGTAEPFYVEPVPTSTTDTTIVVTVLIGNGETVLVETESGLYTATGDFGYSVPAQVEIQLLPNTVNHLKVTAQVKLFGAAGECQYGGYTLSTTVDRNGGPLEVEQKSP